MSSNAEILSKLEKQLAECREEQVRLAHTPYSQSNPGAVMERREIARDIDRLERKIEKIKNDGKE